MAQRQSLPDAGKPTPRDVASLWDGTEIVLSAIVQSPLPVRVKALDIGKSDANHASALGKAILAYLPDGQADAYLSRRDCAAYRTAFPPLVQEAARAATRNLLILGCAGLSRPL